MYGFETPTITVRIRVVQSVWRSTYQSWRNSIAPWAKPTSPPVLTRPYSRSKMPCNGHQFGRKRRTSKPKLQNSTVNFNNLIHILPYRLYSQSTSAHGPKVEWDGPLGSPPPKIILNGSPERRL